ncbi:MAG: glycosyltransferase family 9 protein [Candidatus Lokiarchaeota archaeon]|nr:glycosyltransferase family 9 protein [Candidatus Lokiarchaeota archaeon]
MIEFAKKNKILKKIINFGLFFFGKFLLLFIPKKPKKIELEKVKKILVNANLFSFGNFLLFSPVIRNLKELLPNTQLTVLMFKNANLLFIKGTRYYNKIIEYPQNFLKLIKLAFTLRYEKYDIVISNYYGGISRRDRLFYLLTGIPYRITNVDPLNKNSIFFDFSFSSFFTHKINIKKQHEVETNLNLIRILGLTPINDHFILRISKDDEEFVDNFFKENKIEKGKYIFGFHAGSNPTQKWKRWDKKKFGKLADMLKEKYNSINIFFGGPDEISLNNEIKNSMKTEFIDCAGKITVTQLAAMIKRCTLLVSNDAMSMHVASIVKTPSFVIIGPTDYVRSRPFYKESQIIKIDLDCSRCYRFGGFKAENCDRKCLKLIKVEDVFQYVEQYLSKLKNFEVMKK